MGDGNLNNSRRFLFIVFLSLAASCFFLPIADFLLLKLGFKFDIHRVFSRLFLLFLLIGLFKSRLFSSLDFKKLRISNMEIKVFTKSFLFGLFFIFSISILAVAFNVRRLGNINIIVLLFTLFESLLTGIVIGVFETFIVWFLIFDLFEKDYGTAKAYFVSVFIFFISHFLRAEEVSRDSGIYFFKGLEILYKSLYGMLDFNENLFYMMGILLLGILFTELYLMSKKNFWVVAGIHAGAVFMIKFDRYILDFYRKKWEWLVGSSTFIDGVLGWIGLLLLIIYSKKLAFFLRCRKMKP